MTNTEDNARGEPMRGFVWRCAVLGMWFGMLTGFVEVAHQQFRRVFFDRVMPEPQEVVWAIPVLYLVFFMLIGLVVGGIAGRLRRAISMSIAVFVFVMLAAWSQFLLHPRIGSLASLLLSAGIAVQSARVASKHADALLRLAMRTTPLLMGLIVVIAVGRPLVQAASERSAIAALPEPPKDAPNVLLILLDTVRADHLKLYGYHRDTSPTIDAIGREGIVFERVMATASWTVPTHAALFTGRYTHELQRKGWLGVLNKKYPTIAEAFTASGYAAGGFVGNISYVCVDRGFARGFSHFEDFYLNPAIVHSSSLGRELTGAEIEGHLVQYKRNSAETVTNQFLGWLADQDGDRPFFGFLNYFDAHALYLPPPPYDTMFGPKSDTLMEWRSRRQDVGPEEMAGFERAYDGCIALIDHHISRLLDALRERGDLENTLLVITADHGEHFGEFGLLSHANSLYREALHVPLVISFPKKIAARSRVTQLVSLRDVAATIMDVAGIKTAEPFPGTSLAHLWQGIGMGPALSPVLSRVSPAGGNKPDWWPISTGTLDGITVGNMHYIRNGDGTEELYDLSELSAPSKTLPNLIGTPAGDKAVPALREKLQQIIE